MQIVIWSWKARFSILKRCIPIHKVEDQLACSVHIVIFRFLVSFFFLVSHVLRPRVIKCTRARHDAFVRARRRKLPERAVPHKSMTQVTGIDDLAAARTCPRSPADETRGEMHRPWNAHTWVTRSQRRANYASSFTLPVSCVHAATVTHKTGES